MSPRTVITWAENYLLFKDIEYSFKLSFLNRCDELERSVIEEYFQRSFGIDVSDAKVVNVGEWQPYRRIRRINNILIYGNGL